MSCGPIGVSRERGAGALERLRTPGGTTVTYTRAGSGPPLILVHGSFSDHRTNWEFVAPLLREHFTLVAIARRGRGGTDPTEGHTVNDEAADVAAVIESIGEPVFLLGHSYGGQCALGAARIVPDRIRKLVVYEAPWPDMLGQGKLARLEALAAVGDWDGFAVVFFRDVLSVPVADLDVVRETNLWPPIVDDARATLGDLRALSRHEFSVEPFRALDVPVLLQTGSESPHGLYVTDALAEVLPRVRIEALAGQAHEGMTTAPGAYAAAVTDFLVG